MGHNEPHAQPDDVPYVDPHSPDPVVTSRHQVEREKARADDLALQMLFSGRSTYRGTRAALRRLATRAGKPTPQTDSATAPEVSQEERA
ncbi:hypothetical protein GCM10009710_33600 [Aeromicrobium alkaliterrae]|uniref:Uncharacterized protein n=1 Tax=Aeromicrobium alkaliterrae TaxID=302168 RepID=A0ABP4WC00_9ACTN